VIDMGFKSKARRARKDAGEDTGRKVFEDTVMGAVVSAIQFG